MLYVDGVLKNLLCTMLDFPITELKPLTKTRAEGVNQ